MFMYNSYMPPPYGWPPYGPTGNPPTTSPDIWERAMKWMEKQERKRQKKEDDAKKNKDKKNGDGPSPFQLFVFLTAITPFVGPASVWAMTFMMRQAFQNLQAIVPH